MYYFFSWDKNLDACSNTLALIGDYLPYSYNIFSQKTQIDKAKKLLEELNEMKQNEAPDALIYVCIQSYRQELEQDTGDFKKRLDFIINQMEENNPALKGAGKIGQGVKLLWNAITPQRDMNSTRSSDSKECCIS